jgi:hypothetical protein
MDLLKAAYRDENLEAVMCRNLISVDWQGSPLNMRPYAVDFQKVIFDALHNFALQLIDSWLPCSKGWTGRVTSMTAISTRCCNCPWALADPAASI